MFPYPGHSVENSANVIGGALSRMTDGEANSVQVSGAMNQIMQAKDEIGNTSIMAADLNIAANGIASATALVGDVVKSVFNASAEASQ